MEIKKNMLIVGIASKTTHQVACVFRERGWYVTEMNSHGTDRKMLIDQVGKMEGDGLHVDALLVATGKEITSGFEETDMETWKDMLHAWLGGAANACKAVAPHMVARGDGRIMIVCPDYKEYETGKGDCILNATASGTLHGFAKSFGTEVAPAGVRVNVLWPGIPFDDEAIAEMAWYLAETDTYTAAQVISVAGKKEQGA